MVWKNLKQLIKFPFYFVFKNHKNIFGQYCNGRVHMCVSGVFIIM
jgi:hypothetical protein